MAYMGRRRIFSKYKSVDSSNVAQIVRDSITDHQVNVGEMKYLWDYLRGKQPVLDRDKKVRPEICNKVVENHAQEVVNFKTGYQLSEPIQYICRTKDSGTEDEYAKKIAELNSMMFSESSESKDRDLFEWMCVCGVGYKFVESDTADKEHGTFDVVDLGEAPFNIHIPEPWSVFIVYSSAYHHEPLMGVWVSEMEDGSYEYTCYTNSKVYTVHNDKVVSETINGIGLIPIIEYDLNNAMMGVFEAALPVLDAINNLESNRMDHIEQVVQALYLFKNCQIDRDEFLEMLELGAVSVTAVDGLQGDVGLITNDADQTPNQTIKDDLYDALVNICGMPSRNQGGANDTGSAVLLRDGWSLAESHAKSYEMQFKKADRNFLRVVLSICAKAGQPINLRMRDIDLAFNRRNYDNLLTKAQVLTTMLATGKVATIDCFKSCGMFTDPAAAYLRGMEYEKEQEQKALNQAMEIARASGANTSRQQAYDHDGDGVVGEDNHGRTI